MQRQHDGYLEESRRFRVDDHGAVRGKEGGDLLLRAESNRLVRYTTNNEGFPWSREGREFQSYRVDSIIVMSGESRERAYPKSIALQCPA